MIVESCTDEVVMENELLKQEVNHLTKDLIMIKGKEKQVQPQLDNHPKVVKKLGEEATVTL